MVKSTKDSSIENIAKEIALKEKELDRKISLLIVEINKLNDEDIADVNEITSHEKQIRVKKKDSLYQKIKGYGNIKSKLTKERLALDKKIMKSMMKTNRSDQENKNANVIIDVADVVE